VFLYRGTQHRVTLGRITELTPILSYRGFWDVPRIFVVTLPNGMLVFDSPFDDTLDDYSPDYAVYYLPWSEAYRLHGTWETLVTGTKLLGQVPVAKVEFDQTRRLRVSTPIVECFANRIAKLS